LQWWVEQAAWGRTLAEPAVTQHLVDTLTAEGLAGLAAARPYDAINATAGLVALGLAIPVGLRLGPAYALLIVVNLVPPLLMGGAVSLGRFTATLFPLFLWMAAVLPRGGLAVGVAFATLQGFAAVIFYTWRPLY
jgi:hypothetical protein